MRKLLAVLLTALATGVAADDLPLALPQLYDVVDVADDDHLNVRAAPNAGAEIIGTLASDARDIEVTALSRQGNWGQVNVMERAGWVALRYLAPQSDPAALTDLSCFGTEPFWNINFGADQTILFSTPEQEQVHQITSPLPIAGIGSETFFGLRFDWIYYTTPSTALILPGQCNDGMSDRRYALQFIDLTGGLRGCCSLG